MSFPIPNNQWKKFENQNLDIALNVLIIEGEMKFVISKYNTEGPKCVDLLLIQQGKFEHSLIRTKN